MTTSHSIQTPIDRPLIQLSGVRIYAERNGTTVLGRATFPYETYGRGEVPIAYQSRRPDNATGDGNPIDEKTQRRIDAVKSYRGRVANRNGTPLREIARQVGREFGAAPRSIQTWVYKYEIGGAGALRAKYSAPPPKVAAFDPRDASDAVLVCAWWAFRIGNVDRVDTKMMHDFVSVICDGSSAADLIATIDCYYSYPCNRERYPFRPHAKWLKYDLTKWIIRAAVEGDYRRALAEDRRERTALHAPPESLMRTAQQLDPQTPDVRMRIRDARDNATTHAVAKLAGPVPNTPTLDGSTRRLTREERQSRRDRARATAKILGPEATRKAIASTAPGIKPLVSPLGEDDPPTTIAESLARMPDNYRVMLLEAANGSRDHRDQAVATMPLWWDLLPQQIRNNIDFRVSAWRRDHSRTTDQEGTTRKLRMLLNEARREGMGGTRISVALRLA